MSQADPIICGKSPSPSLEVFNSVTLGLIGISSQKDDVPPTSNTVVLEVRFIVDTKRAFRAPLKYE